MNEAYITGTGAFLPGDPVDNEQLSARFAADTPRAVKLLSRTLAANGIKTRHYAVDDRGMTLMLNEELAAEAARRASRPDGLSMRVDWMHLVSHAHSHPVCMSAGLGGELQPRAGGTWLDRPDPGSGRGGQVPREPAATAARGRVRAG